MGAFFPSKLVRVARLYEIQCDACGCNPGSEFFVTRTEADEARRDHIAIHRRPEERVVDRLTPATPKATAAHRWTRHGHHCCGTTTLPESTRPPAIARCGGPAICRECAVDAAQAHVAGDGGDG